MNLFARHSRLLLPVAACLFLAAGWLDWKTTLHLPWGWTIAIAFILLFLARLKEQWRSSSSVHDQVGPAWQPRVLRLESLRVLGVATQRRWLRFEFVILVLLAAGILYQVLLPPVVGLADNGDFGRLMDQTGLSYVAPDSGDDRSEFVELHFLTNQPREPAAGYVSSELILVGAALILDKLVSADGLFDLRVLGALHAAAFLVGLLLVLTATRSLPRSSRWASGLLLLVVFTDVGYVAYLNSLYREPAALIFLTLTVGCALHCIVRAPKTDLKPLLGYFACAILFTAAKPEYAPQGLLLAVFGLLLARRGLRRWYRWVSAVMAVVVCLTAVWSYSSQPTAIREVNLYNHLFSDLLTHSPAPEADLAELGLDRDLIQWTGTDAFDKDAPIDKPAFREKFFGQVTYATLLEWYAAHPVRFAGMLDRVAREGFSLRSGYLGNFERSNESPPGTLSNDFDAWSEMREYFPSSLAGLLVAFGLAAGGAALIWRRCEALRDRMLAELFLLLMAMAAVGFVVAGLGGGALDIVKHLFAFNLLVDMGVIMAGGYLGKWWEDVLT